MLACDPHTQLSRADAFVTGQLSLQLHEQADRCITGKHSRKADFACGDVDVHPIIDPSRGRRLLNVKFGGKRHVSSREILPSSSGLHSGVTESVAITASDSNLSKNPIRARSSLRGAKRVRVSPPLPRTRTPFPLRPVSSGQGGAPTHQITAGMRESVNRAACAKSPQARISSRMTATMKPRQSGHRQIAMCRMESPFRVMLREAGRAPVSCDGYPAQALCHVAAPRGLVRTLHQIRPLVARREHGRAGASSQL